MDMAFPGHPAHLGKTIPMNGQGKMALAGTIMASMAGMEVRFVFDREFGPGKPAQLFMNFLFHRPHDIIAFFCFFTGLRPSSPENLHASMRVQEILA
jgi:hypothetical protein